MLARAPHKDRNTLKVIVIVDGEPVKKVLDAVRNNNLILTLNEEYSSRQLVVCTVVMLTNKDFRDKIIWLNSLNVLINLMKNQGCAG